MGTIYRNASLWNLKLFEDEDKQFDADGATANAKGSSDDINTQLDAYSDALSSVMEDDSGYITRLPTWESAESANNNQLRQRRGRTGSGSTEDGEVRAEVNVRREGRKKSMTPRETALPKPTNMHADASVRTAARYAEEVKSTDTCDDASDRPVSGRAAACHTEERTSTRQLKSTDTCDDVSARSIFGRAAAHHTEEKTSLHHRLAPLQLVLTRDMPTLTDVMLPDRTSAEEQQRPESSKLEEQPRRVTVKEIGQELAELRRLGRLAKDLDQLDETAVRISDLKADSTLTDMSG